MAKPIVKEISAFDATVGSDISVSYYSPTIPTSWYIEIFDASTGKSVKKLSGDQVEPKNNVYVFKSIIGKSVLKNDQLYYCVATPIHNGSAGVESNKSNTFRTYAKPIFVLNVDNKINDGEPGITVQGSTVSLSLIYNSSELLYSYQYFLYDSDSSTLLENSTIFYDEKNMRYSFRSISEKKKYVYVRAIGYTQRGLMQLDTGLEKILIKPSDVNQYATLHAESDDNGNIHLESNLQLIEPTSYNYNFDGDYVDLTAGKELVYKRNFKLNRNFTLSVKMKDIKIGTTLVTLQDDFADAKILPGNYGTVRRVELSSFKYEDNGEEGLAAGEYAIFQLKVFNPTMYMGDDIKYTIYSEKCPIEMLTDGTDIIAHIRCIDSIYNLKISAGIPENIYSAYWFGSTMPDKDSSHMYDTWLKLASSELSNIPSANVLYYMQTTEPTQDVISNVLKMNSGMENTFVNYYIDDVRTADLKKNQIWLKIK